MSGTYAKVIADSVAAGTGIRLTSMELCFPRFVLPQFLMHRLFSRSCESLRARPVKSKLEEVSNAPYVPQVAKNQRGMAAGGELEIESQTRAYAIWRGAAESAIKAATELMELGVAKQWANRLLEPFAYQKVLVTATDYQNFFRLRCDDAAQPEIQELAVRMREALEGSVPTKLYAGRWHLPYVTESLHTLLTFTGDHDVQRKVSAARCARVSYVNHEGVRDYHKDIELAEQLTEAGHSNPFEHVCTPTADDERYGNLKGWRSFRWELEATGELPDAGG